MFGTSGILWAITILTVCSIFVWIIRAYGRNQRKKGQEEAFNATDDEKLKMWERITSNKPPYRVRKPKASWKDT